MKRIYVLLMSFAIALSSCATVKDKDDSEYGVKKFRNEALKTIISKGEISTSFANGMSAGYTFKIAATDSISASFRLMLGGVMLGKLYSRPDYFKFYNVMENILFEGIPKADNLSRAIIIPISYEKFIRFLRCESPSPGENYKKVDRELKEGGILYRNDIKDGFVEYIVLNPENKTIQQYQLKNKDGETILNVKYEDYENVEGFYLANIIKFHFPEQNGNATIKVSDYKVNGSFTKPFDFTIPEGIKRFKF